MIEVHETKPFAGFVFKNSLETSKAVAGQRLKKNPKAES